MPGYENVDGAKFSYRDDCDIKVMTATIKVSAAKPALSLTVILLSFFFRLRRVIMIGSKGVFYSAQLCCAHLSFDGIDVGRHALTIDMRWISKIL